MAMGQEFDIGKMLSEGWQVIGFSTSMMAAGGLAHSILMQREVNVVVATMVHLGNKEIGRTLVGIAPYTEPEKKGFWS